MLTWLPPSPLAPPPPLAFVLPISCLHLSIEWLEWPAFPCCQENICCLNTALVFLLFAHRKGKLGETVCALRAMEDKGDGKEQRSFTQNFRKLLWFWQQYYLNRGRDCHALEFSSRVGFKEWMDLVQRLCSHQDQPGALCPGLQLVYIDEQLLFRPVIVAA